MTQMHQFQLISVQASNAEQLAAEVERAINTSYGDDKKFQLFQNVDDTLTIDFFKQGTDGTSEGLR